MNTWLWVLWLGGSGIILGGYLLWRGLRGKRIDTRPVCGRCGFDLAGIAERVLAGGEGVCPECGAGLLDEGVIQHGARRKRPGFLVVGGLLLLFGLGSAGLAIWSAAARFDWNTVKPHWLLVQQATSAGPPDDGVLKELLARRAGGTLPIEQFRTLVLHGLARQGDPSMQWAPLWGDLLMDAHASGELSPEQQRQFVLNQCQPTLQLRGRVESGKNLPYRLRYLPGRGAANATYRIEVKGIDVVLTGPGGAVVTKRVPGGGGLIIGGAGAASLGGLVQVGDTPLAPGTWKAAAVTRLSIGSERYELTHEQLVEVLPRGRSSVTMVDRPELREQFRIQSATLRVSAPYKLFDKEQRSLDLTVFFSSVPMPVAFTAFAVERQPDGTVKEWRIASVTASQPIGYGVGGLMPADFGAKRVDVVLRADPMHAESTVDIEEVCNGELVVPDVPVERR
ncbi:MAG TPA: hypothetical protein VD997_16820 [Phycisphaerales bacterium]|nr:hypothetical protein [Phycisphaerales bacterium]